LMGCRLVDKPKYFPPNAHIQKWKNPCKCRGFGMPGPRFELVLKAIAINTSHRLGPGISIFLGESEMVSG